MTIEGIPRTCEWENEEYLTDWETDCGKRFIFYEDGPTENGFRYCPFCGKLITEKAHAYDEYGEKIEEEEEEGEEDA